MRHRCRRELRDESPRCFVTLPGGNKHQFRAVLPLCACRRTAGSPVVGAENFAAHYAPGVLRAGIAGSDVRRIVAHVVHEFHYMDAGIASTLLFVYPVMVAVIMAIFFRERISLVTVLSISLALCGIALLYRGEGGAVLNTAGVVLVMASSLSYALYIVVVNRASLNMSSVKLTFYVLLFGVAAIVLYSLCCPDQPLQLLSTPSMWGVGGDAGSDSYGRFAGVDDRCRACHRFYSDRCYGGFGAADGSGDRRDYLR